MGARDLSWAVSGFCWPSAEDVSEQTEDSRHTRGKSSGAQQRGQHSLTSVERPSLLIFGRIS